MPILHTRLPEPLDARLKARAEREGKTPSELAREALEAFLAASAATPGRPKAAPIANLEAAPPAIDLTPKPGTKMAQLNLWITAAEDRAVRSRAERWGTTRPGYVGRLLRAHLTREAQPDRASLTALREAVRELAAVGRNLNQLAHVMNVTLKGGGPSGELLRSLVDAVRRVRDESRAVTQANLERWVR